MSRCRLAFVFVAACAACDPDTLNRTPSDDAGQTDVDREDNATDPVAVVEAAEHARVGDSISISGAKSYDPDGRIVSYTWSFVSRPSGSRSEFADATLATSEWVADVPGTFVVGLVVADDDGLLSRAATAAVSVSALAYPVARIEPVPETVEFGAVVMLDGRKSYDPDGVIASYAWRIVSMPSTATATLTGSSTNATQVRLTTPGSHVIALLVVDNDGLSDTATVGMRVREPCQPVLSDPRIDFGDVVVGYAIHRGVTLTNRGQSACAVSEVDVLSTSTVSPDFSYVGARTFSLAPGASHPLDVVFHAPPRTATASLRIAFGGLGPNLEVSLLGRGGCAGRVRLSGLPAPALLHVDDDLVVSVNGEERFRDFGTGADQLAPDFSAKGADRVRLDFYDIGWCRAHGDVWAIVEWAAPELVAPGFDGGHCSYSPPAGGGEFLYESVEFEVPLGPCLVE